MNPEFIGRRYPASAPYQVGREKIREFATAIGDANPAYHDVAAAQALGYADLVAPPTFAIVVTMKADEAVLFDPELGLDFTRVVHGEQHFAYTRPIVAGDELTVSTVIENIREVAGNDMITTRSEIATTTGEPVGVTTAIIVSRGADA